MCPDGVVAYHGSLSSFRPGSESRSGRLISRKMRKAGRAGNGSAGFSIGLFSFLPMHWSK